jgi:hypothetical protein
LTFDLRLSTFDLKTSKKMTFEVKDEALRQAAGEGMDAFINVIVDAIKQGVGGELSAETMPKLTADQITLLAYIMLRDELMDGGFIQLIHNGYGPFFFRNPFDKAVRQWGEKVQELTGVKGNEDTNLIGLCRLLRRVRKCYDKYHNQIEKEMSDEDFMALYEQLDVFDDFDDEFVSNEESYTEDVARYVDEHLLEMVKPV